MKFHPSSLGSLMTAPKSIDPALITPDIAKIIASKKRTEDEKAELERLKWLTLPEGAKSFVEELAAQEILGIDFTFSSKETEKGIICEPEAMALINRVKRLNLTKNTQRVENEWLTGEADFLEDDCGHDAKCAWSAKTFHILAKNAHSWDYEWQMRAYMMLYKKPKWFVHNCLVATPEHLIGRENPKMHKVSHIEEFLRVTSWCVIRDLELEEKIKTRCELASKYMRQVIDMFDDEHASGAR